MESFSESEFIPSFEVKASTPVSRTESSFVSHRTRGRAELKDADKAFLEESLAGLLSLEASEPDKVVSQHTARLKQAIVKKIGNVETSSEVSKETSSFESNSSGKRNPISSKNSFHQDIPTDAESSLKTTAIQDEKDDVPCNEEKNVIPPPVRNSSSSHKQQVAESSHTSDFVPSWITDPALREFALALGPDVARTLMPHAPDITAFPTTSYAEKATSGMVKSSHFKCDICKQPFSSDGALRQHIADVHSNTGHVKKFTPQRGKLLKCKECSFTFYTQKAHDSHECKGPPSTQSRTFRRTPPPVRPKEKQRKFILEKDGWRKVPVKYSHVEIRSKKIPNEQKPLANSEKRTITSPKPKEKTAKTKANIMKSVIQKNPVEQERRKAPAPLKDSEENMRSMEPRNGNHLNTATSPQIYSQSAHTSVDPPELRTHAPGLPLRVVDTNGSLVCPICDRMLPNRKALRVHLISLHNCQERQRERPSSQDPIPHQESSKATVSESRQCLENAECSENQEPNPDEDDSDPRVTFVADPQGRIVPTTGNDEVSITNCIDSTNSSPSISDPIPNDNCRKDQELHILFPMSENLFCTEEGYQVSLKTSDWFNTKTSLK